MKKKLINHIESLDLYSYTISAFEVEIKRFIAQIEDSYSEDERVQFEDLPFLDCKLQTRKKNPKRFKSVYDAVRVASSTDEARQALLGFKVEYNALIATDGRRLASFDYAGPLKPGLYDKNQKPSIDAGFPDYKKILPQDFNHSMPINEQHYYSARAAMQYYRLVKQKNFSDTPAVRLNTKNLTIAFNVDFFCDGLNALYYANNNSFDNVILEYISDIKPLRLRVQGTNNIYYLMPCKIFDGSEELNLSNFQPVESSPGRKKKRTVKKQVKKVKPEPVESLESVETVKPEPVPESVDIEPVQPVERDLSAFAGIEEYLQGLTRKQRKNLEFVQRFDFNGVITEEKRISFINRMHLNGLLTATIRESSSKVHYLVCGQYVGENTYCYARFLINSAESKQEISA